MKPLRIAYLVNQYPKVSHTFIRREILALEAQGVEVVRLAVRGWDNPLSDPLDHSEQERTHYLLKQGAAPLLWAGLRTALNKPKAFARALQACIRLSRRADRPWPVHLVYLLEACMALQWLKHHPVTHLHAHFGANSAEVAMLIRLLGGPQYSFTVHGPEEFDKPEFIHLREKIAHSAFVVAITAYCKSQLMRWVPHHHWPKIQVVHCGLEPEFHQGHNAPPSAQPRLVCVGRLCEQKGQLLLLEAAHRLRSQGVEFQLVLAGDGEMRPIIEQTIAAYSLQACVHITGWISSAEVREELIKARAMVLPSFAEGLPVVIMEAMALQRPVLTTWVAGIPELVTHGEHGYLVPPGDIDALVQALQKIIQADDTTLQRMGLAAQHRVLQRHSIQTESGKLLQLFQRGAA
ncbi:MAG TPA: glycosyltransferase [Limnobacter sp.]|uniref:glycosyltransferase n=1 Tax=Limnobacter sp. TaxID=2003368 RepID=UPI002EDB8CBA